MSLSFVLFLNAKYRIERSFLSASSILIALNFLVSYLIDAVSSSSYRLCFWMFLSILAFIRLSGSFSVGFSNVGG